MALGDHAALLSAVALLRRAGPLDMALVQSLSRMIGDAARTEKAVPLTRQAPTRPAGAAAPTPTAQWAATSDPLVQGTFASEVGGTPRPAPLPSMSATHPWPDGDRLTARPSVLQALVDRADLAAPRRGPGAQPGPQGASPSQPQGPAAPLESLFPPGRVRAILRELATVEIAHGAIDLSAAVMQIARGQPLSRLPLRRAASLGHSVQLLFDVGPGMLPFSRDKQQLAASALRLLGKERLRLADFIGDPLQGVRVQGQVRWAPLHWPGRQSAVMVVSDLGLGGGADAAQWAQPAWQRFVAEAANAGLRTVVMLPYGRSRWPAVAKVFDTALTWDLGTGVQALRRAMRRASSGR